ncbi:Pollen Ole e 1 allergen and extensin family protein [Trifolium repens]|nr:Pollen Ole e 1 allergen and extensin family protein [Trifolium repens]
MAFTNTSFLAFMLLIITSMLVQCSFTYASGNDFDTKKQNFQEKLLSNNIGIQGLVYCKSGSKLIPLEGAVTRIRCEAVDEYGFETKPFTFLSDATDAKGYFLATLFQQELVAEKRVLKECRTFLDASPLDNCNYPTDFNKGISGAELLSYSFLHDKKMNLYTVGPFVFTSTPKSISDGY